MKARTEHTVVRWRDIDGKINEESFLRPKAAHVRAEKLRKCGFRPAVERKLVDVTE